MSDVVVYSSVSVDGFIADEDDHPGPLFDWLVSGPVPLDESGVLKVSRASYDYTRTYWDQIDATIVGRQVFDLAEGWGGTPPSGVDHVIVVTHRPAPAGWNTDAPFHFVDSVEPAVAKARELAGDRIVEIARGGHRRTGACRGTRRRGTDGCRARRVRVGKALFRIGRCAAPAGRS